MTNRFTGNFAGRPSRWMPVLATVALLGGVAADRARMEVPSGQAERYHAAVRAVAAAEIPYNVGPWLGVDTTVPTGAVALLKPNVLVARAYRNVSTGRHLTFLLVQCSDARDLLGHYPPNCYPAHGMRPRGATPVDWTVDDGPALTGMRYAFEDTRRDGGARIVVDNFLVLPDGTTSRDMGGVHRAARDPKRKFLGAAQVQLVSSADMSDAERDEAVRLFANGCRRTLAAIRSGDGA